MQIAILGAGTWGCTLATLLYEKGFPVKIWDISSGLLEHLDKTRIPPKLPNLRLPAGLVIEKDLRRIVKDAAYLVITVPSHAVRDLCASLRSVAKAMVQPSQPLRRSRQRRRLETGESLAHEKFVLCSKGIEQGTLLTLSGVMEEVLGEGARPGICCLSGPSHAEEVSRKMPTSIVAAAYKPELAHEVQALFHTDFFRVYIHDDVLGVQLGGALKNVIAIAAGVCDGLGFGDNTKAALLTRGLAEMIRLGVAMGAKQETFSGLSGVGDLIVTATSRHSRNRNFGELIAKGRNVEEALNEIGMVVEGVKTASSVAALAEKYHVAMPISVEVYRVLYEGKKPKDALRDLMGRSPKPEIYGPESP